MHRAPMLAAAFALAAAPFAARAQETPPATPEILRNLLNCRSIADDAQRLACFDSQAAAVAAAEQSREIVVYDRGDIEEAQRDLFGLQVPQIRLLGEADEQLDRIETTITDVSGGGYRPWVLRLADGTLWVQIDSEQLSRDPRAGHTIVVERAALGSFRAEINNMRPIRVRREE